MSEVDIRELSAEYSPAYIQQMFRPGQTGNPAGKARQTEEERRTIKAIQSLAQDSAQVMRRILDDPKSPPLMKIRVMKIILDRTYGKPKKAVRLLTDMIDFRLT